MPTEDGRQLTLPVLFGLAILSALEASLRKRFSLRLSYGKFFYSGNLSQHKRKKPPPVPLSGGSDLRPRQLTKIFLVRSDNYPLLS
jgi:hypothetical protein